MDSTILRNATQWMAQCTSHKHKHKHSTAHHITYHTHTHTRAGSGGGGVLSLGGKSQGSGQGARHGLRRGSRSGLGGNRGPGALGPQRSVPCVGMGGDWRGEGMRNAGTPGRASPHAPEQPTQARTFPGKAEEFESMAAPRCCERAFLYECSGNDAETLLRQHVHVLQHSGKGVLERQCTLFGHHFEVSPSPNPNKGNQRRHTPESLGSAARSGQSRLGGGRQLHQLRWHPWQPLWRHPPDQGEEPPKTHGTHTPTTSHTTPPPQRG